ncbi:hypothetical protein HYDPIDRAFT_30932 [Hydnomerulius pinastri MD-312]|uniref:DUF6533 domain-containing protein n=1 Tax=Hydnomerulius pinastri MD-312 TaxID=994086 RepID=A0A0C9WC81_9AGAM|nr:hypothetical protein HYDPIDRAFT_30932 [Hydnomerulius pinastri MD-312]
MSNEVGDVLRLSTHQSEARYFAMLAITVLAWDSILTFNDQQEYIWKKLPNFMKLAWVLNRYGIGLVLVIYMCFCPTHCCRSATYLGAVLFCVADAAGNGLTIFRVSLLWDGRAGVRRRLLVGAIMAFIGESLIIILMLSEDTFQVYWYQSQDTSFCAVKPSNSKYYFAMLYICQALFDVFAMILVLTNVLDIPRTTNGELWTKLFHDGAPLLLVTFVLRIMDIALTRLQGTTYALVGMSFMASIIATLNARLVLLVLKVDEDRAAATLAEGRGVLGDIMVYDNC